MAVLFTVVALLLLVAGSIGLILTCSNYSPVTLDWVEGILTYGIFVILGLSTVVFITLTPRER